MKKDNALDIIVLSACLILIVLFIGFAIHEPAESPAIGYEPGSLVESVAILNLPNAGPCYSLIME